MSTVLWVGNGDRKDRTEGIRILATTACYDNEKLPYLTVIDA